MNHTKKVGERLEEILKAHCDYPEFQCDDCDDAKAAILALFKSIMPEEKVEGKHDGHVNDDRSWCYTCEVSADENEFTNNYNWNAYRTELLKRMEE